MTAKKKVKSKPKRKRVTPKPEPLIEEIEAATTFPAEHSPDVLELEFNDYAAGPAILEDSGFPCWAWPLIVMAVILAGGFAAYFTGWLW